MAGLTNKARVDFNLQCLRHGGAAGTGESCDFIQEPSVQHLKGLLGEVDPKVGPGVPGLRFWFVSKFAINVLRVWVCVAG